MARKQARTLRPVTRSATTAPASSSTVASQRSLSNRGLATLFRMAKDDEPCPKCESKMHRKAVPGRDPQEVPPIVYDVLRSPGRPLDEGVRTDMEQRFGGADFSEVRIHTDSKAAESADAVNAKAYTVGSDIVGGNDLMRSTDDKGTHLLAHELTHVLQQMATTDTSGHGRTEQSVMRAANPALVAAGAIILEIVACSLPYYLYAMKNYSHKSDKYRHCWVSCQISKTCGLLIAELAGLGKEIRDRAISAYCENGPNAFGICDGGHGDFWDSIRDLQANQVCMPLETLIFGPIARLWNESCEDCCDAAKL